jgi:hypothetical protein
LPVTAEDCLVAVALRRQAGKSGCTVATLALALRELGHVELAADTKKIEDALSRNVGLWQVTAEDGSLWALTRLGEAHVDVLHEVTRAIALS